MNEALFALPSHLRRRLTEALDAGLLSSPYSHASLRSVLGLHEGIDDVAAALASLGDLGISGPACAGWIRTLDEQTSRMPKPDLVWSGPEVPGTSARDTRRVYEELLGSALRSVWVSSYVYFDGPRAFEVLARRMDEIPGLRVTLLLNIQRRRGDTTAASDLVRRFGERFWGTDWPGRAKPQVFYDPRSVDLEGPAGYFTPRPSSPTTSRYS
jgi:hypothetical protein